MTFYRGMYKKELFLTDRWLSLLEEAGIATVTITLMKDVAKAVKPPRSMYLKFPFGSPMGRPDDVEKQITVLKTALQLLEQIDSPGTIIEPNVKYGFVYMEVARESDTYSRRHWTVGATVSQYVSSRFFLMKVVPLNSNESSPLCEMAYRLRDVFSVR